MRRRLALTAVGAAVLAMAGGIVVSVATAAPASATLLPKVIALPDGHQPEGIATKGVNFYVGSVADGAIVGGNVLTGRVTPFVAGTPGDATPGLEVSGDLLFAAGAGTGTVNVYDLRTGRKLADRRVAPAGESFINDVSARTGVTRQVDLGGASLTNGDGLLRRGDTLYVMRNQFNQIVRIELGRNYASGQVTGTITDPNFDTPTTIAAWGPFLYAVNARLTTPPTPTTAYTVVRVP